MGGRGKNSHGFLKTHEALEEGQARFHSSPITIKKLAVL